jgi:hypothetical protein
MPGDDLCMIDGKEQMDIIRSPPTTITTTEVEKQQQCLKTQQEESLFAAGLEVSDLSDLGGDSDGDDALHGEQGEEEDEEDEDAKLKQWERRLAKRVAWNKHSSFYQQSSASSERNRQIKTSKSNSAATDRPPREQRSSRPMLLTSSTSCESTCSLPKIDSGVNVKSEEMMSDTSAQSSQVSPPRKDKSAERITWSSSSGDDQSSHTVSHGSHQAASIVISIPRPMPLVPPRLRSAKGKRREGSQLDANSTHHMHIDPSAMDVPLTLSTNKPPLRLPVLSSANNSRTSSKVSVASTMDGNSDNNYWTDGIAANFD